MVVVECHKVLRFKTDLDSFKKDIHDRKSSSRRRINTTEICFSFSSSVNGTTKLYQRRHRQAHKSKKQWIFILINFMDIGALLEFKHFVLSNIGKDPFMAPTLQESLLEHLTDKDKDMIPLVNKKPLQVLVVARPSCRIYADFIWSKKLISLLVRHAILLTQTRVNSTLGGAYASLHHIHKAAWWARYQLYISSMLGDSFLQTKSLLHLAFYFIRVHQFSKARHLIKSQRAKAIVMESDVVIADAAELALSKEILASKLSRSKKCTKET